MIREDVPTMGVLKQQGYRRMANHPEFKYLTMYGNGQGIYWRARIPASIVGKPWCIILRDPHEAAVMVDKELIRAGRKPINVLKPKT